MAGSCCKKRVGARVVKGGVEKVANVVSSGGSVPPVIVIKDGKVEGVVNG